MTQLYLQERQRKEMKNEIATAESEANNPANPKAAIARKYAESVKEKLEKQSAPVLKGPELDAVVKEEKELREQWQVGMLSHEEMRKNPPGAVDRLRAWEKKNKSKVLRWKNAQRTINPDNDDQDLASIERFRPKTSQLNMDNAQIQGTNFNFPSEAFKEGFDQIDWEPLVAAEVERQVEKRLAAAVKAAGAKK